MNDNISGWNTWSDAFAGWTDVTISEIHGLMTGLMTACNAPDEAGWAALLSELSFEALPDEALTLLTEEAEDTVFQLKDKDDALNIALHEQLQKCKYLEELDEFKYSLNILSKIEGENSIINNDKILDNLKQKAIDFFIGYLKNHFNKEIIINCEDIDILYKTVKEIAIDIINKNNKYSDIVKYKLIEYIHKRYISLDMIYNTLENPEQIIQFVLELNFDTIKDNFMLNVFENLNACMYLNSVKEQYVLNETSSKNIILKTHPNITNLDLNDLIMATIPNNNKTYRYYKVFSI